MMHPRIDKRRMEILMHQVELAEYGKPKIGWPMAFVILFCAVIGMAVIPILAILLVYWLI